MAKLLLQITAEVLNCMVHLQRDNEHLRTCSYLAEQDELKVSMVTPVLHSTAEVNMVQMALQMTKEANG